MRTTQVIDKPARIGCFLTLRTAWRGSIITERMDDEAFTGIRSDFMRNQTNIPNDQVRDFNLNRLVLVAGLQ
jgi:hypothetical protein